MDGTVLVSLDAMSNLSEAPAPTLVSGSNSNWWAKRGQGATPFSGMSAVDLLQRGASSIQGNSQTMQLQPPR